MDCMNCSARNICKIYDAIQKYQYAANITITNCTVKPGVISSEQATLPSSQPVVRRSPEELMSISQRIKELSKAEVEPAVYATCPDCEEEAEQSSMIACTSCGNTICRSCIVTSKNTPICEECYFKHLDKKIDKEVNKEEANKA